MNTCFYFDSRWNVCFTLTITASFHWEIRQNLTIFCVTFSSERYLRRNFLLKLQAVLYQLQFYQRWTSLVGYFKKFLTKSVGKIIFRWIHLFIAFTQAVFTEKVCFIVSYSFTRLNQTNEIYFAASWWALVIKARCNVVRLYCSLILRFSQRFTLSNGAIIGKDRLQVD